LLLVEVALATLAFARGRRGSLYARAGIPEYWIFDLAVPRVEVHREPHPSESARYGWQYASVDVLFPGAEVAPVAAPRTRVRVEDLLPGIA
jgi:Uma2 family endonuclease